MTRDCPVLGRFEAAACDGTLEERGSSSALTTRSPGRAYRFDTPEGRSVLGLVPESPCADGGFWLPQRTPRAAVVAELKAGSVQNAEHQLTTTTRAVNAVLDGCEVEVIGLLCLSGGAPVGQAEMLVRFRRATGRVLKVKSGIRRRIDVMDALGG